nr:retrovirus-related Pol polyprotein from transposon TNT 1-94 [Tanacetum cinerariifolium]
MGVSTVMCSGTARESSVASTAYTKIVVDFSGNVGSYRKVTTSNIKVNELRAERLAMEANLLALVTIAQARQDPYNQTSKSHKSYAPSSKPLISSRSHTTTRHKGNEIAKPITPPSETASEEDSDPEQAQRDKDMQKNLALIAKYFKKIYKPTNNNLRTSSNSRNKNVDTTLWFKNGNQSGQFRNQRMVNVAGAREKVGSLVVQQSGIQCFKCKEFRHFAKECRKPKRVKDSVYHMEKMLLCKQDEQGVPLQAEQYDWLEDTDEEVDEQELEAHYSYMAKIQEVPTADSGTDLELVEQVQNDDGYNVFANDLQHSEQFESISNTCLVEMDDSNVIPDSPDILKFVHELKQEMHADLSYVEFLKKEIDKLESDKAEFSDMYDVILQECVSKNVMCSYLMPLSDLDALDELQCLYLQKGNDLLTGKRGSDLYTISLQESTSSTPLYLMAKASPTQACLWHQRLSHLNFDYINLFSKKDIVIGLPKLKYVKDQLYSSCELSKAKRSSFKLKDVPSSKGRLNLLHMD